MLDLQGRASLRGLRKNLQVQYSDHASMDGRLSAVENAAECLVGSFGALDPTINGFSGRLAGSSRCDWRVLKIEQGAGNRDLPL